jgi:thiamine biosynthesis lipoprotein
MTGAEEVSDRFACFGSWCAVYVTGYGREGSAGEAVASARSALLSWHERFSRFLADSELSRVNADEGETVAVSPMMARLARATILAGSLTDGLVDATLLEQIERAGYGEELRAPLDLSAALELAPDRMRANARASAGWSQLAVDMAAGTITRPAGVQLDSGGLAKGLFADALGERLATHPCFAINCAGDLMIGGTSATLREIHVESPFDGSVLHTFECSHMGVATSGISRRSWLDSWGRPAHHLLDPSTGMPAFTGVVQATALAPSALLAEVFAKAALLSGPRAARQWLKYGGVIVLDDGSHQVVEPPSMLSSSALSAFLPRDQTAERSGASTAPV